MFTRFALLKTVLAAPGSKPNSGFSLLIWAYISELNSPTNSTSILAAVPGRWLVISNNKLFEVRRLRKGPLHAPSLHRTFCAWSSSSSINFNFQTIPSHSSRDNAPAQPVTVIRLFFHPAPCKAQGHIGRLVLISSFPFFTRLTSRNLAPQGRQGIGLTNCSLGVAINICIYM